MSRARSLRQGGITLGFAGALAWAGCADPPAARTATPAPTQGPVMICAPGSFQDGNECLPVKPECPPGAAPHEGGCAGTAVAREPDPPASTPPAAAAPPDLDVDLDGRRIRLQPRSRKLLVTEVQGLESLFKVTPKDSSDRPRLMRRLAEEYVELAAAAVRDGQTGGEEEARKAKKIEEAARLAAIKYYQGLAREYPRFCASASPASARGSTGCADEALYYLGSEYIRVGQLDMARKAFLELVRSFPDSSFLGHAYFQFGEMFLEEARQDPSKRDLAEKTYQKVLQLPGSPLVPWALFRLAQIHDAAGEAAKAAEMRSKVAKDHPSSGAARLLTTLAH